MNGLLGLREEVLRDGLLGLREEAGGLREKRQENALLDLKDRVL